MKLNSTGFSRAEAIRRLKANPSAHIEFATRPDPTFEWTHHKVWLDEDGDLVMSHPTDSDRGPIAAPDCDLYKEL